MQTVSPHLGGHGVVSGRHVLAADHGDGEVRGAGGELAGLVVQRLGGVGVQQRRDRLAWPQHVSSGLIMFKLSRLRQY